MFKWGALCILGISLAQGTFICNAAAPGLITNPLQDFLARDPDQGSSLLELRADLSGDGRNQIFYSWSDQTDGKAGNVWTVYTPSNGYFACDEDALIFRRDAFYIGTMPNLQGPALMSYFPAGALSGSLRGYQYDGYAFRELPPRRIEPMGKDASLYNGLFGSGGGPQIHQYSREELQKMIQSYTADRAAAGIAGTQMNASGLVGRSDGASAHSAAASAPFFGRQSPSGLLADFTEIYYLVLGALVILSSFLDIVRGTERSARFTLAYSGILLLGASGLIAILHAPGLLIGFAASLGIAARLLLNSKTGIRLPVKLISGLCMVAAFLAVAAFVSAR